VEAQRGNWWQVGLHPNPLVGYVGYQLGSGGRAEQQGVLIEQEFVTGRKLALNREIACQQVLRAEQEFAAQQQRVLTDVRMAFFDALVAQRRFEIAQSHHRTLLQDYPAVERMHRAGETELRDLLPVNLEHGTAEVELNKAANQHARAWWSLAAVAGVPQMAPAALRGDLETVPTDISWNDTLQRLLSSSPEIAIAMINVERARWAVARARAEPIPNMKFQGAVLQDNGIGGKTDGNVELVFPLPLFNKNAGAIRQAEAELMAAERALAQLELDLQHRLAPVYERYATAANQVRRYRERILPTVEQSLDLARRGYEGGLFPYLDLLAAQRTFFETNMRYVEAIRELRASAAEIEGLLLKDSLAVR
jgi:cobalt-zinc-cadmium efflux system outer membrane protein